MVAIIDYGVGNLFSLQSSLAAIGQEAVVTSDIEEIRRADRGSCPVSAPFRTRRKSCGPPAWTGL